MSGAFTLTVAACAFLLTAGATPATADHTIASRSGPKVRVVTRSKDPVIQRTAKWLREFLIKRGYQATDALPEDRLSNKSPIWMLETRDDCAFAESLGIKLSGMDEARADAYTLTVSNRGFTVVSVVGRDASGVRAGVARLVSLMSEKNGKLVAPETCRTANPFFPIRRLMVCPTGRITLGNEWCRRFGLPEWTTKWQDTLWENWSDERIRKYAEQLWLYGFNSVELAEIRGYRGVWTDEDLKNKITPKLRVFMQAARDYGLQVSQFIWGQSLFEEGRNFCWNSPEERSRMEAEYRRLARTYGDLVDHIVIHVGDPGGCDRNGCDAYKTTQEIATYLLGEYRKVNPKVTCTLSTWANFGFWKGEGGSVFLDESFSPQEVGVALHRWYDPEKAKLVVDSGRACDIWGWYLSDFELDLDMALFMRRLDAYYTRLPEKASSEIRALSTEINFHGWPHIINAYVSAQKMWNPKRGLEDIEREFCAGTFGDSNAEAMLKVYKAVEEYVHPERYYGFIPASDCLPVVFGTHAYNQRLRAAVQAAKTVRLDPKHPPRFTASTETRKLYRYLVDNLELIRIFSEAQEKITEARSQGADASELARIVTEAETKAAVFKDYPDHGPLAHQVRKSAEKGNGG